VQESPPPLGKLIASDRPLRSIALGFALLAIVGVAILATVIRLLVVDDIWVKIVVVPIIVLIPGLVLRFFVGRLVGALRGRVAVLRRLADHGVILDARFENEEWIRDSEGSRFWTAQYTYSYLGKPQTVRRSATWSAVKTPHPESLRLLIDPERPADAFVLGSMGSGRSKIGSFLNNIGVLVILLWVAGWAFLFFGGIRDDRWGPIVILGMFLGMPLLWVFTWIVSRLVTRTR
jgi:hypothetical protein